jgi:hypothetical protein
MVDGDSYRGSQNPATPRTGALEHDERNRDFSPIIDLRVRFGLYEREHNNNDTGHDTHKDRELDVVILEGSCARYTELTSVVHARQDDT